MNKRAELGKEIPYDLFSYFFTDSHFSLFQKSYRVKFKNKFELDEGDISYSEAVLLPLSDFITHLKYTK